MKQSLAQISPELSTEWHPTKNGTLTPNDVSKCSSKKVWWKGVCGHEWEASIANRVKGRKCPYCSNRRVLSGLNDLQTVFPEIAVEWDVERNQGILPSEVPKSSGKKYWWKCSKSHNWQASIDSRTRLLPSGNRNGCPYCSNKRILIGFNDLSTTLPELAKEWHPTKNANLKSTNVTRGCSIKVWWLCRNGHSFQATIANRTAIHGTNCPYCSNQKLLKGYNDLLSCYPQIAAEWAYWYSYAMSESEAKQEANAFLQVIKNKQFAYPVYFDLEEPNQLALGKAKCSAIAKAFMETMEKAGYFVGLYMSKSYLETYISEEIRNKYVVWVAHYGVSKTNYSGQFGIWQKSDSGSVSGISGNVDLNECYFNYPALIQNAGLNGFAKSVTVPNSEPEQKQEKYFSVSVDNKTYSGTLAEK